MDLVTELCLRAHDLSFMRKDPVRASYAQHQACRRIEISAEVGPVLAWRGIGPHKPRYSRERLHNPGTVSHGRPYQEMVVIAVSFVTVKSH